MELDTIGDEKTVLFLIMSDTDTTFNFMYHTSDRRRTMARMLAALPDMDTEMRQLANSTIAKLERMTDADFNGQRFDFAGE